MPGVPVWLWITGDAAVCRGVCTEGGTSCTGCTVPWWEAWTGGAGWNPQPLTPPSSSFCAMVCFLGWRPFLGMSRTMQCPAQHATELLFRHGLTSSESWLKSSFSMFGTKWGLAPRHGWAWRACHVVRMLFSLPERITQAIDQSHRYWRHQVACREPAGSYDKTTRTATCFEHKTQYILICAPYTHIVVFWHIRSIPPWFPGSN